MLLKYNGEFSRESRSYSGCGRCGTGIRTSSKETYKTRYQFYDGTRMVVFEKGKCVEVDPSIGAFLLRKETRDKSGKLVKVFEECIFNEHESESTSIPYESTTEAGSNTQSESQTESQLLTESESITESESSVESESNTESETISESITESMSNAESEIYSESETLNEDNTDKPKSIEDLIKENSGANGLSGAAVSAYFGNFTLVPIQGVFYISDEDGYLFNVDQDKLVIIDGIVDDFDDGYIESVLKDKSKAIIKGKLHPKTGHFYIE